MLMVPGRKRGPALARQPRACSQGLKRRNDCAIQELRPPTKRCGERAMSLSSRHSMSGHHVARGSSTKCTCTASNIASPPDSTHKSNRQPCSNDGGKLQRSVSKCEGNLEDRKSTRLNSSHQIISY